MTMRAPVSDLPIVLRRCERSSRAARRSSTDVSLTFAAGAPTVLIGPNGAGKTTLLRLAMGLVRAARGRVTWGGRERRAADAPRHRVPAAVDAAAQRGRQHPLRAGGGRRAARRARARACAELLALVGLAGLAERPAQKTVRRRAAAARARPRAGQGSGRAVPRRADRQSRSRRHQGDRGRDPRGRRARHQGRDGDARSRRGAPARRRHRAAAPRPRHRERPPPRLLHRAANTAKPAASSPANCCSDGQRRIPC